MLAALYVAGFILVWGAFFAVLIFTLEVIVGSTRISASVEPESVGFAGSVCVLVPAHNEEAGIVDTLRNVRAQLGPSGRVVVVADNCSDNTAEIARVAGAEVTERTDSHRRGKGYALDWGMNFIASSPPDVVVIVDADCQLDERAIERLASRAMVHKRPVQALYLMTSPTPTSGVALRVSEFAWTIKNQLRPLGLKRANLPCQLMGTGMAFPWALLRSADLASADLVEDLRLGLDLAKAGAAPEFLPTARVTSTFPSTEQGALAQRQRWEQGHLRSIAMIAAPFLWTSLVRRNWRLTAMSLDLMVPPVSLLAMLVVALFVASAIAAFCGLPTAAFYVSALSLVMLTTSISVAWFAAGQAILPPAALLSIPSYVSRKIPIYTKLILGKASKDWVRSDRT